MVPSCEDASAARKKKQLILDQRAADIGIVRPRPLPILAVRVIQIACNRRGGQAVGVVGIGSVCAGKVGLPQNLAAEVPFVAAAFADHVDHAASERPYCRAIAAGIDFLLFDGAIGKRDAAQTTQWIGCIESIDVISVLARRRTAEADQRLARWPDIAAAVVDDARRELRNGFSRAQARVA